MANSKITPELLALGDTIVQQLGPQNDTDLLSKWIAQHLAEKLKEFGAADKRKRETLAPDLFDTILKLWVHRSTLPNGKAPFERFTEVFRALESLDPKRPGFRYLAHDFPPQRGVAQTETRRWLDGAKTVDRAARAMISYCVASAAASAGRPEKAWLEAARVLPADQAIKIVLVAAGMADKVTDPNEEERAELAELKSDIQAFQELGALLSASIDEKMQVLAGASATLHTGPSKSRQGEKRPSRRSSKR